MIADYVIYALQVTLPASAVKTKQEVRNICTNDRISIRIF